MAVEAGEALQDITAGKGGVTKGQMAISTEEWNVAKENDLVLKKVEEKVVHAWKDEDRERSDISDYFKVKGKGQCHEGKKEVDQEDSMQLNPGSNASRKNATGACQESARRGEEPAYR
ncbi:hypothetical protein NDU88_005987 [Pleurodeles waltl]|uniref:Uncharacterized protein n=1 Tax=Pleurodeles waltl TaxID=8319 RepID=A0AAV7MBL9_PLEWA|nr:hypothetical protein NDU88_005987 [Pleurodeles waltl]